jgi:hypothetical protein
MITTGEPVKIDPGAIYGTELLLQLGISWQVIAKGRQTGALRSIRRGRQILYQGSWILAWLEMEGPADER